MIKKDMIKYKQHHNERIQCCLGENGPMIKYLLVKIA
jgi:hypothetical protein